MDSPTISYTIIVNDYRKSGNFLLKICVLSFCVKIFRGLGYPQKILNGITFLYMFSDLE